ncbi:hypothetical protein HDV05_000287 [Chytridiales sp. JEL 0842]|nr:hypothetical protein HDV05_000287 [Chytridiales sp. JEL 0842]
MGSVFNFSAALQRSGSVVSSAVGSGTGSGSEVSEVSSSRMGLGSFSTFMSGRKSSSEDVPPVPKLSLSTKNLPPALSMPSSSTTTQISVSSSHSLVQPKTPKTPTSVVENFRILPPPTSTTSTHGIFRPSSLESLPPPPPVSDRRPAAPSLPSASSSNQEKDGEREKVIKRAPSSVYMEAAANNRSSWTSSKKASPASLGEYTSGNSVVSSLGNEEDRIRDSQLTFLDHGSEMLDDDESVYFRRSTVSGTSTIKRNLTSSTTASLRTTTEIRPTTRPRLSLSKMRSFESMESVQTPTTVLKPQESLETFFSANSQTPSSSLSFHSVVESIESFQDEQKQEEEEEEEEENLPDFFGSREERVPLDWLMGLNLDAETMRGLVEEYVMGGWSERVDGEEAFRRVVEGRGL